MVGLDDARTWADVVHDSYDTRVVEAGAENTEWHMALTDAVAARERELGRQAEPFELRIEVLPLTTAGIWWIADSAIAVDEALRDNSALYREALRPFLERLV